jgi:hypothetical protein
VLAVVGIERRLCCKREEAKGIFSAYRVSVCGKTLLCTCKELTDIICVPKMGFCAFVDLNVSVLVARTGWLLGI